MIIKCAINETRGTVPNITRYIQSNNLNQFNEHHRINRIMLTLATHNHMLIALLNEGNRYKFIHQRSEKS